MYAPVCMVWQGSAGVEQPMYIDSMQLTDSVIRPNRQKRCFRCLDLPKIYVALAATCCGGSWARFICLAMGVHHKAALSSG